MRLHIESLGYVRGMQRTGLRYTQGCCPLFGGVLRAGFDSLVEANDMKRKLLSGAVIAILLVIAYAFGYQAHGPKFEPMPDGPDGLLVLNTQTGQVCSVYANQSGINRCQ